MLFFFKFITFEATNVCFHGCADTDTGIAMDSTSAGGIESIGKFGQIGLPMPAQ